MIQPLDVSARGELELTDDLKKYVRTKIGKLDRYMNRHARKSVRAEVRLDESKKRSKDQFTAEVILHMPGETLTAKESTLNIFAAVDIVEAKIKNQLKKYKEKHVEGKRHVDRKRVLQKLRRVADRDFWGGQN